MKESEKTVRCHSYGANLLKGRHTTIDTHMTPAHQQVAGWNAKRLLDWAQKVGPNTHATVESMLGQRKHPQQSYRAWLGVLRMGGDYSNPRLEAACSRALALNAANYRSVSSILKNGLDKQIQTDRANHLAAHAQHGARPRVLPLTTTPLTQGEAKC